MKRLALVVLAALPFAAHATTGCKSAQTQNPDDKPLVLEVCLEQELFAHHIYTFSVSGEQVFKGIDDDVKSFAVEREGVRYAGGCQPRLGRRQLGGMEIPVELGRECAITVGEIEIGGIEFTFD